jgi:hypothetical protein
VITIRPKPIAQPLWFAIPYQPGVLGHPAIRETECLCSALLGDLANEPHVHSRGYLHDHKKGYVPLRAGDWLIVNENNVVIDVVDDADLSSRYDVVSSKDAAPA